ncbi:MAG: hypothetical protein J0I25_12420 [Sphingomonadales bacterium]|nr:hypothetical protein [Sphingomonadales bacterium]
MLQRSITIATCRLAGRSRRGDHDMRMFEAAASLTLVIAVQALVVGVVSTAF